jgi:hypothetical protein
MVRVDNVNGYLYFITTIFTFYNETHKSWCSLQQKDSKTSVAKVVIISLDSTPEVVTLVSYVVNNKREFCSRNNTTVDRRCSFTFQWQEVTIVVRVTVDAQNVGHALPHKFGPVVHGLTDTLKSYRSSVDQGTAILNALQQFLWIFHFRNVRQIFYVSPVEMSGEWLCQDTGFLPLPSVSSLHVICGSITEMCWATITHEACVSSNM